MMKDLNLSRFLQAQESTYALALSEIKNGTKESHWMWFIFPQIAGLASSSAGRLYAIKSSLEAREYLNHEILGKRLIAISNEVLKINGKSAYQIFDHPDNLKLRSCMTLFASLPETDPVFQMLLDKYFQGRKCDMTVYFLQTE